MRYVYFYQLFFTKNNNPIDASVKNFLLSINKLEYQRRIVTIEGYPVVLNSIETDSFTKLDFYTMVLLKNNTSIFKGSMTEATLDELKEDIAEVTTFLYSEERNLMLIELNKEGVTVKNLKLYLQQFLKNTDLQICINPIEEEYSMEMLEKTSRISSIDMRIKIDKSRVNIFKDRLDKFSAFSAIFDTDMTNTLDAETISIMFRTNRSKSLNLESTKMFVRMLNLDDDSIESIKVNFKHAGRIISMDIKDFHKPMKDVILEDSDMKQPLRSSVRSALQMLLLDKYAGRFDNVSELLLKKMEEYLSPLEIKLPPIQPLLI